MSNIKRKFLIVYPDTWYFVRSKNVSQYSCFKDCKMVLINISKVYNVIFLQKLYYSWRTMHLSNILTFPNHRLMDSLALHIVSLLWRRPSLGVVLSQYGEVWRNKFQKGIYQGQWKYHIYVKNSVLTPWPMIKALFKHEFLLLICGSIFLQLLLLGEVSQTWGSTLNIDIWMNSLLSTL